MISLSYKAAPVYSPRATEDAICVGQADQRHNQSRRWLLLVAEYADSRNIRAIDIGFGVVLIAVIVALFWRTWAAWPDLQIDCGREMYVPAQMVAGKQLYRDLWYPYGPLAPTLNSVLFRLFGVQLNTLYFTGLALASASTLLLYAIARRLSPPLVSGSAALCFGFSLFAPWYFNYILPYSYAATYGSTLSFATLYFLMRWLGRERGTNLFIAGCFASLAALTKFEFGSACYMCIGLMCAFRGFAMRSWRAAIFPLRSILPGLGLVAAVYGWLLHEYTFDFLVRGNWTFPGSYFLSKYGKHWTSYVGMRFDPSEIAFLTATAFLSLCAWSLVILCFRSKRWWLWVAAIAAFAILPAWLFASSPKHVLSALSRLFAMLRFPAGIFAVPVGVACWFVFEAWCRRGLRYSAEFLAFCLFGITLGIRCFTVGKLSGYNLYYSPLVFVLFVLVLWRLVALLTRGISRHRAAFVLCCVLGLQMCLFAPVIWTGYLSLARQSVPLPSAFGEVRVSRRRAQLLAEVIPLMEQAKAQHEQVLLLPEYTGLYFITGSVCPDRFYSLTPGVIEPGKYLDNYLRNLDQHKPTWVILSNRATPEYGAAYFGIDYYPEVLSWVNKNYVVDREIGHFNRDVHGQEAFLVYRPRS